MDRIDQLKEIVKNKQHAKVDGVSVDLFTTNAITTVYDALSPENQERYRALPVVKMAKLAFALIK